MSTDTTTLQPEWVTINQAAEYLGADRETIRRMISRGDLRARKYGQRFIRVSLASLREFGEPLGGTK